MKYNFEILVIDAEKKQELSSLEIFQRALVASESLLLEFSTEDQLLVHKNQGYELSIQSFYEEDEEDYNGYTLKGESDDIKTLLEQRGKLLSLLTHSLKATYVKTLNDDVSIYLGLQILPLIHKVDWAMRKLLVNYYAFESGPKWWDLRAPSTYKNKVEERQSQVSSLQQLVDTNIEMLSLQELGEIVDQPNRYFLETFIAERVLDIETMDELADLQEELRGEEVHPFQKAFEKNFFAEKWSTLVGIHKKVIQNQLLHPNDLSVAEQLFEALMRMIQQAKNLVMGHEDDFDQEDSLDGSKEMASLGMNSDQLNRDQFDEIAPARKSLKIITEAEILRELKETESIVQQTDMRYIGLKNFVTKILANKGYSIGPSYALINILNEQGVVDIYDYIDPHNPYPVKAVRSTL